MLLARCSLRGRMNAEGRTRTSVLLCSSIRYRWKIARPRPTDRSRRFSSDRQRRPAASVRTAVNWKCRARERGKEREGASTRSPCRLQCTPVGEKTCSDDGRNGLCIVRSREDSAQGRYLALWAGGLLWVPVELCARDGLIRSTLLN